jgi:hypothetical protein
MIVYWFCTLRSNIRNVHLLILKIIGEFPCIFAFADEPRRGILFTIVIILYWFIAVSKKSTNEIQ